MEAGRSGSILRAGQPASAHLLAFDSLGCTATGAGSLKLRPCPTPHALSVDATHSVKAKCWAVRMWVLSSCPSRGVQLRTQVSQLGFLLLLQRCGGPCSCFLHFLLAGLLCLGN